MVPRQLAEICPRAPPQAAWKEVSRWPEKNGERTSGAGTPRGEIASAPPAFFASRRKAPRVRARCCSRSGC